MLRRTMLTEDTRAYLTFNDLTTSTDLVLPVTHMKGQPVNFRFLRGKVTKMIGTRSVKMTAEIMSQDMDKSYTVIMDFYNVGENELPSLSKNPVRARCSCAAYYFWFSYANKLHSALSGRTFTPYVPVQNPKRIVPPRNPNNYPGLCKHLIAFGKGIVNSGGATE